MALNNSDIVLVSRSGNNYGAPVSQFDSRYQRKNENISALSVNGGSIAGFRNRVINGNFIIDQRNNGSPYSISAGLGTYTVDRWNLYTFGSNCVGQVIENPAALRQNLLRVTGAAGNTRLGIYQRIESFNISDLAGKEVTFSFSTSNTTKNSINWNLVYPSLNDNYSSFTVFSSGTISINSTMTRYSVTRTLPAECVRGLQLLLEINNQTSGSWSISDVQLEQGPLSTIFERRPIQLEDILCKRYFQYCPYSLIGSAQSASSILEVPVYYPVKMRIVPTIGTFSVDPSSGTSPELSNLVAAGVNRRTVDFAAPYIQAAAPGTFLAVGYRVSLDSEI